jgi:hypothetical protein
MSTTLGSTVSHVAALTTSTPASYSNPSGAFGPMPDTALKFELERDSLLVVTFSARGAAAKKPGQTSTPIVFIGCELDGAPCEPDGSHVEFLYPPFCCDTRAFSWVVHLAPAGSHVIEIQWGMGNPGTAVLTNRSLIAEAAEL